MTGDRASRLESLFHAALGQPEDRRREWLRETCADDPALVEEVERLLAADAGEADPITGVLADAARFALPLEAGQLGPWRILEELGAGGMGSVYLAERADAEYRRRVAIKVIRGFPDSASLERLRSERQILADLSHPNIAAMLDGGATGEGQPYLVMEYVEGTPVDRWCRERQPGLEAILRLFIKVCDAVHYAHQHLVIHRDIKPENVLVTSEGEPKLLDFGIAKLLPVPGTDADDAATRMVRFYTPGFASPEQLHGEPVSTASDVFSLGRLLIHLLKGYDRDGTKIPRDLRAILFQATRDDPAERYPDVWRLRADLERFLDGRPVEAVADRVGYRLRKFVRRHRYAVVAGFAAVVVSMVLVSQIVIESRRAREAEAQARVEAANANQVLEFLIGLIETGAPGEGAERDVTVAEIVARGRRQLSDAAIDDPAVRGRMLYALGEVYQALEDHEAAIELLTEAAALARENDDPAAEARALAALGISHVLLNELDDAEVHLERARALAADTPGLDDARRAEVLNNWGVWAIDAGRVEEGRARLTEALDMRRRIGAADSAVAASLHNLSLAEGKLGNLERSLELAEQALALKERNLGRLHPSYALSLRQKAFVARQLGRYDTAREAVEETLALRIELYGADHPGLQADYNELANAHHDLGELERAIAMYRRALELDRAGGRGNAWILLNNLAAAHEDRGDPAQAETLYRRSIGIRERRFGAGHANTLRARHNLARVLLAEGRTEEASAAIAEVVAARAAALGDDHHETLRSRILASRAALAADPGSADALADLERQVAALAAELPASSLGVLNARGALGRHLIDAGRLADARVQLETSIRHYRSALGESHPKAALLELDLARIDLLQDASENASTRLAENRAVIVATLASDAAGLRQLACLEDGDPRPSCWRIR